MKKGMVFLGSAFLVLAFLMASVPMVKADDAAGQKLFTDHKCNTCHSIDSQKVVKKMASSKAPDLSTVGDERNSEWIVKWLNKEEALDGKKHPSTWSGKPEEQKALADWLASLKKAK